MSDSTISSGPVSAETGPAASRRYSIPVRPPAVRRLRGYAFDPSLSTRLETAGINEITYSVPWEVSLDRGPTGEYLEVVDYDPSSDCFYEPVDLNNPYLIAQDGLAPSEGSPQFHQQMTYAVAMTTIRNFEQALGRKVLWRAHTEEKPQAGNTHANEETETFIQRLRIYPHAMREANAFYSPAKKALLFGYFNAITDQRDAFLPGGTVFTCLSHDIIAHETTHALLDGVHRRMIERTHPDSLAFHEAFSDIVALFQHFTFPEVLRSQIGKTRGDLTSFNLLGQLAQEFGVAIGNYGALRDAIGQVNEETKKWEPLTPDPQDYLTVFEPHARGSILVAAVFDAFTSIYRDRTADLLRIASGGTGVLPSGALHPDLVKRLADEAAKAARHVLLMCIRALDYCPPVNLTFGDYLRALITADMDIVPIDDRGYRLSFLEAFRRRGIYPQGVRNLSVGSLCWPTASENTRDSFKSLTDSLRAISDRSRYFRTRQETFEALEKMRKSLREQLCPIFEDNPLLESLTGLVIKPNNRVEGLTLDSAGEPSFEIHSLQPAQRVGPDGDLLNQLIISITQERILPLDPDFPQGQVIHFRGGCTLILDLDSLELRYLIVKPIWEVGDSRLIDQRNFIRTGQENLARVTYFSSDSAFTEPFAMLHRGF